MKAYSPLRFFIMVLALLWLTVFLLPNVSAEESRGAKDVKKELEKDIGMPILAGNLWQQMTHDDKIAFVWGFFHVVSIENYLVEKYPQLKTENFSAKVIEASHKTPKTANEVVALVDAYYQKNPAEIKKPVIGVLWDEMIKPNITTGVAGLPLNR